MKPVDLLHNPLSFVTLTTRWPGWCPLRYLLKVARLQLPAGSRGHGHGEQV